MQLAGGDWSGAYLHTLDPMGKLLGVEKCLGIGTTRKSKLQFRDRTSSLDKAAICDTNTKGTHL
jgi:hypothetical protein